MATIQSLDDNLLQHIILLSYLNDDDELKPWKVLNTKFHNITAKILLHFELYSHLHDFCFAKWKVVDLKRRVLPSAEELLNIWQRRQEYHQKRVQEEAYQAKTELLFGGRQAFHALPFFPETCDDLIHGSFPFEELKYPFMRGFDMSHRQFVSIKIPTGPRKDDPYVLYLLIKESYWRIHHWSGDKRLIGKVACYLNCLAEPYGFNRASYMFCLNLFKKMSKKEKLQFNINELDSGILR